MGNRTPLINEKLKKYEQMNTYYLQTGKTRECFKCIFFNSKDDVITKVSENENVIISIVELIKKLERAKLAVDVRVLVLECARLQWTVVMVYVKCFHNASQNRYIIIILLDG